MGGWGKQTDLEADVNYNLYSHTNTKLADINATSLTNKQKTAGEYILYMYNIFENKTQFLSAIQLSDNFNIITHMSSNFQIGYILYIALNFFVHTEKLKSNVLAEQREPMIMHSLTTY